MLGKIGDRLVSCRGVVTCFLFVIRDSSCVRQRCMASQLNWTVSPTEFWGPDGWLFEPEGGCEVGGILMVIGVLSAL